MKYGLHFTSTKPANVRWYQDEIEFRNDEHLKFLLSHYYSLVDPDGTGPFRMRILSRTETETTSMFWHDTADEITAAELVLMWQLAYPDPLFRELNNWKRLFHEANGISVSFVPAGITDDNQVIINPGSELNFVAPLS